MKKLNIKGLNINVDPKNFWYLVIYGGIIFLIVLVGIFPLYKYNSSLNKENQELKYKIEEQKELGPVYLNLLKSADDKTVRLFPVLRKQQYPARKRGSFRMISGQ